MDGAAALVVPGSGRLDRNGRWVVGRGCRLAVAEAERLATRLAPRAVVFSGWSPVDGPSEAEQMRDLWRGPDVELVVEPTASTTAENAARTLPLLLERGVEGAEIVCTPAHLYRVRWFFHRIYGARGIRVGFRVARVAPTPAAVIWEVAALSVRARQLRAARAELEQL
jgi:hypothetical protein